MKRVERIISASNIEGNLPEMISLLFPPLSEIKDPLFQKKFQVMNKCVLSLKNTATVMEGVGH